MSWLKCLIKQYLWIIHRPGYTHSFSFFRQNKIKGHSLMWGDVKNMNYFFCIMRMKQNKGGKQVRTWSDTHIASCFSLSESRYLGTHWLMERERDSRREEEVAPVNITSFTALFLASLSRLAPSLHELFQWLMTKEHAHTRRSTLKDRPTSCVSLPCTTLQVVLWSCDLIVSMTVSSWTREDFCLFCWLHRL